ncbi:MAG: hypothetical protein EBR00_08670, partial [Gammaproteobacteria bacterium]|nr:hypothetical protein [Gammaproteobacteria bacterium]
ACVAFECSDDEAATLQRRFDGKVQHVVRDDALFRALHAVRADAIDDDIHSIVFARALGEDQLHNL